MGAIIGILFGIMVVVITNILTSSIKDKRLKIKVAVLVFVMVGLADAFTVAAASVISYFISLR